MQSGTRYIIGLGVGSLFISALYFLSLAGHIPFIITVPVCFLSALALLVWVLRGKNSYHRGAGHSMWAWAGLLCGVYLIVHNMLPIAEQYGGWDGWGIWNLHARYLADGSNWTKMFQNKAFAHPEYPLYIPSLNGFFMRLYPGNDMVIPFIFNMSLALLIPVLIYLECAPRNLVVAALVLFLFATDTFFLTKAATQYADTALAFFFLCAMVSVNYVKEGRKYIALTAASLAGCMWTKNEGIVLAVLFMLAYPRTLFLPRHIKGFVIGMGLPLLAIFVFKYFYAPESGFAHSVDKDGWAHIFDKERYDIIWRFFTDNLSRKFYYVGILFFLYLLMSIVEISLPDKQFVLLLVCMAAYTMIYVLSPGVEWLLDTSQERLMHQLMPALVYVIAMRLTRVKLSIIPKKHAL